MVPDGLARPTARLPPRLDAGLVGREPDVALTEASRYGVIRDSLTVIRDHEPSELALAGEADRTLRAWDA